MEKIRAASVNPLDWHFMRGTPYAVRIGAGLRKPKVAQLGADVAGQVEAVGRNITQFKPGDQVFGTCKGAFAEYACAPESAVVMMPDNLTFEQRLARRLRYLPRCRAFATMESSAWSDGLDQGRVGSDGYVRCADRQVIRRRRDRRVQHEECGHGPIHRR
jgi:NADPH:quinone reductase-like Zn-dependent oxidoreductase